MKFEIEITYQKKDLALATEMFEVGDFWLEIRVINKKLVFLSSVANKT